MGKSEYRPLRWLETAPDNYVEFHARQRQWSFSYRHPWLWAVYRAASKARCVLLGHEWSPCIGSLHESRRSVAPLLACALPACPVASVRIHPNGHIEVLLGKPKEAHQSDEWADLE
jgi:hypothetical protein